MSDREPTLGELGLKINQIAEDVGEVKVEQKEQRSLYVTRAEHAATMEQVNRELALRRQADEAIRDRSDTEHEKLRNEITVQVSGLRSSVDSDLKNVHAEVDALRSELSGTMWKASSLAATIVGVIISVVGLSVKFLS